MTIHHLAQRFTFASSNYFVLRRQFSRYMGPELNRTKAYIDGEWVAGADGVFEVRNPANNKLITNVADCTVENAKQAVECAKAAFKTWGFDTTAKERHDLLLKWFRLMIENREELAQILTKEMGKPLAEAVGEVNYAAGFLEWFAEEARRIDGSIIPNGAPGKQLLHYREPVGVAVVITPWNFPSAMITRKVGAALAAGCTCVVKPAEDTPLSALALAVLAEKAGIPPGVFNVVPCDRKNSISVGKYFCESEDVATISFTGSTDVGKILLKQSASTVKKVSLELGGNAPFIVFETADLDKAVQGAMISKFRASGQTCVCANRIFVQESVHDAFAEKLKAAIANLEVGDGADQGVTQGPLINKKAVEKVQRLVTDATKNGAKVVCGGAVHDAGDNFYQPTLLTDVDVSSMEIGSEEIFGPVAPLIKFKTEADVLSLANSVRVGLAGYFYSQDVSQIFRVARKLEVGIVGVNDGLISAPEAAFGGVKESGIGREGGHFGIDEYTHWKYVCIGGL